MPNDFITLRALTCELSKTLSGGRINKITMPTGEDIALHIRATGENRTLLLSAKPAMPRVHLTEQKISGTDTPSAFCMLLRKHLTGGVIEGAETLFDDRIISLNITARDELRDMTGYRLITEIMGPQSNIVFTAEEDGLSVGKIIDCVKRVFGESVRPLFPGIPYEPPANGKKSPFDPESIAALSLLPKEKLPAAIAETLSGFSKETAREAALSDAPLKEIFEELFGIYNSPRYSPCVLKDNGRIKGFYAFPYQSIKGEWEKAESLNAAADIFYAGSQQAIKPPARVKAEALLKKLKTKTEKRLRDNALRLAQCEAPEEQLQLAEILKCNLHRVEKAQSVISCYDFYNNREIELTLDPSLSPAKNAEKYYKKYNKQKGAKAYALKERDELTLLSDYLSSIEAGLNNATTTSDYEEIEAELNSLSPQKSRQGVKKKEKPSSPASLDFKGYKIYIGKNNVQNDKVTFEYADGGDLWLHAKGAHGAHVIIKTGGTMPPDDIIAEAASYAAYMSGAGNSPKAEVDYTQRKYVKKAGKPGLVTYTKQKGILVSPKKPPIK